MLKIIHQINRIKDLKNIPVEFGVEVDVRTYNNRLILNHEPFEDGDLLDKYMANFRHAFIILDIKEEGIEKEVITLCKKYDISNYFLLGVSFPFIYILSKGGIKKMAVRYSEFEDINTCLSLKGKVDWVWVDTFTKNPLDRESFRRLKEAGLNICLVCPERWGRPDDIVKYSRFFRKEDISIDAVMTSLKYHNEWV